MCAYSFPPFLQTEMCIEIVSFLIRNYNRVAASEYDQWVSGGVQPELKAAPVGRLIQMLLGEPSGDFGSHFFLGMLFIIASVRFECECDCKCDCVVSMIVIVSVSGHVDAAYLFPISTHYW